ncbi:TrbI/VirB10 family protein [Sphingomonas silueang]|uniref:TrbI/VirB10 family protein n=1 Tax=Sphingomonas silueang TaxID=3156617 RepID=UPI0032B46466
MTPGTDPRAIAARDIRPVVARKSGKASPWVFGGVAALGAILLFATLDGRRRALTAPTTRPAASDLVAGTAAPPQLYVPPAPIPVPPPVVVRPLAVPAPTPTPAAPVVRAPIPIVSVAPTTPATTQPLPERRPERQPGGPALVYDASNGEAAPVTTGTTGGAPTSVQAVGGGSARTRAARLAGQRSTVPQGTLIPAVLETALDSTRPGQARALVSRDVRGFDGSRVLIPRGSRLYGEYRADLAPGQNRALVQWTRLVRPDGVTIAIDSPAADALGRAGIRGKVDSHFLERFGGALLQSSLDLGVSLATQSLGNGSVILLPRGGGALGGAVNPAQQVRPTLTVRQGTRVTVFVARDLDFASVDGR